MAFSATAPIISAEDEQREWAELSSEEKDRIIADICGTNITQPAEGDETSIVDSVTEDQINQFHSCIEDISDQDKACYKRAIDECPGLVQNESNPAYFLLSENLNPINAAEKAVRYWEVRIEIFGEKAFLPMNLTGAMEDDVATMVRSPNLTRVVNDSNDRYVIVRNQEDVERNRDDPFVSVRVSWYIAHLALKHESVHRNGVVLIDLNRGVTLNEWNRRRKKLFIKSFASCLPLKVKALHLVTNMMARNIGIPAMKNIMTPYLRLRTREHSGTDNEVLESLSKFGLTFEEGHDWMGPSRPNSSDWILQYLEKDRGERST